MLNPRRIAVLLRISGSPDWAQRVAASELGMHYLLVPNMEINLDGYFAENCWFPGEW